MRARFKKYFWDGYEHYSPVFRLRRILEYASFPDMIHYPFEDVKRYIDDIDLNRLRTSSKRKEWLIRLKPYISQAGSWEEAINKLVEKEARLPSVQVYK